jgi:hypothetical protein
MLNRLTSVTVILITCASFTRAQLAAAPATQPATPATHPADPAAGPIDPSTPKGALRAFAKASRMADAETLARVSKIDSGDELESMLITAANNYQKAVGELGSAVRAKFGDNAARQFIRDRGSPLQAFFKVIEADLDDYDVVVQGDTAKLVDPHDPKVETNIKLVREGGVWKVASTGLTAEWGKDLVEQRVQMIRDRTLIVAGLAEEVAAGKYDSVEAVKTALAEAFRGR